MERRSFLKASAALGCAATVTGCKTSSDEPNKVPPVAPVDEVMDWNFCTGNCASMCPLKVYSKDGIMTRVETENDDDVIDGENGQVQSRACPRGRAARQRVYAPERLKYPMKRIGKRGGGQWQRISWDEALTTLAEKIQYTINEYGNEAIHFTQATGGGFISAGNDGKGGFAYPLPHSMRLFHLLGGFTATQGGYSAAQLRWAGLATDGVMRGSSYDQMAKSDFILAFSSNPRECQMAGGGNSYAWTRYTAGKELWIVDPKYTDSALGIETEWLPIRPGTDTAMIEAVIHELDENGWIDEDFVREHCMGWTQDTMLDEIQDEEPYRDYIRGLNDGIPKTPARAAKITGIPEETIKRLARKLHEAQRPFILQGLGLNRSKVGEQAVRAVMILPWLIGKIGKEGTSNGGFCGVYRPDAVPVATSPNFLLENKVKQMVQSSNIALAVDLGTEFNGKEHGLFEQLEKQAFMTGNRTPDKSLAMPIKFIWSACGNSLVNQTQGAEYSERVYSDESKCEFIAAFDIFHTPTTRWCDLILPAQMDVEQNDVGFAQTENTITPMSATSSITPAFEAKTAWDMHCELAKKLGIWDEYTEGKTDEEWKRQLWEERYSHHDDGSGEFPHYDEILEIKHKRFYRPGTKLVHKDLLPGTKFNTPSGKVEIYSMTLREMALATTQPDLKDKMPATPQYFTPHEGYEDEDTKHDYPYQFVTSHDKRRTHSLNHNNIWLAEAMQSAVWMNPLDAQKLGLSDEQIVIVESMSGRIAARLKVTPRILPGVLQKAQGSWRQLNDDGIDIGGCVNTLLGPFYSPFVKSMCSHTCRVKISAAPANIVLDKYQD